MALSLVDFQSRVQPTIEWIIPGLLTRSNTAIMMGQPKKAVKSWLLLAAAWDLSEGRAVWGIPAFKPPRPMRTVYFTQEDSEDNIHSRIRAHLDTGREPNDRVWIVPKDLNMKLDTNAGRKILVRELNEVREEAGAIDLVMFDPMRRIHDGNENDSEVIAKLWWTLAAIHNDYGCATIIAHHTVKPPRDKEGWDPADPYTGRGSGDIYGGGDAFVVVVPGVMGPQGRWRQVTAHFESKREQQQAPAVLKMTFATGQVAYLGEEKEKPEQNNIDRETVNLLL